VTTSPLADLMLLDGVADAVERARTAVDAVIAHKTLRRGGSQVALESGLRGARASAALEGVDISLDFLRSGNLRLDHPGRPVAQAALRVQQETPQLDRAWRAAPFEALARLHLVATADLVEDDDLDAATVGRPRSGSATDAPDAPSADEVMPRIDLLARLIATDRTTPALVVAAVVHGELLAVRPFGRRDGLVARAAERLVLRTRGLDPRGVTVPEAGHAAAGRAEYLAMAEGFAEGSPHGVGAWIRSCADAVAVGAVEAATVCDALA
jgi:hypothetical protein